jgi:hypothetical protein
MHFIQLSWPNYVVRNMKLKKKRTREDSFLINKTGGSN